MSLDYHGLAIFDEVEQFRELSLRAMDADVHETHFGVYRTNPKPRRGAGRKAAFVG